MRRCLLSLLIAQLFNGETLVRLKSLFVLILLAGFTLAIFKTDECPSYPVYSNQDATDSFAC